MLNFPLSSVIKSFVFQTVTHILYLYTTMIMPSLRAVCHILIHFSIHWKYITFTKHSTALFLNETRCKHYIRFNLILGVKLYGSIGIYC
jgi:hypothetical protein